MIKLKLSKQRLYIALLIVASLFALIPLLHQNLYTSQDGEAHIARFAAYAQAFQDGQFPPRWAGNLNYRYGTPAFIFYYPLPGYLASIVHATGIGWENTFKLLMLLAAVGAPIAFYCFALTLFRQEIAFTGGILYAFAPYHFLDLYVRGDIAEMLAFVFVPLIFLCIEKYRNEKSNSFLLLGGIFYALLILSHNGVSLMFSPVFLLYALFRAKKKRIFLNTILLFLSGLLISSFFWVPALYEGKYTNEKVFIGDMYKQNFPNPLALIYSPWNYGSDVNQAGGLSPQIGIIYVGLASIGIGIFFRELFKNKKRKIVSKNTEFIQHGLWGTIFLFAICITISISSPLWKIVPILKLYEFPWRFTGLSSFSATMLACFVLAKIKNAKALYIFIVLLLLSSLPFLQVKSYSTKQNSFYTDYTGTTSYHGETTAIWTAGDPGSFPKSPIEIIGGQATIQDLHKKSQLHTFTINAKTNAQILDNTIYFPGWKAFIDNQPTSIQFQDINHRGLITFSVPKGNHHITVKFIETGDRRVTDALSLVTLIMVCILLIYYSKKPLL